MVDRGGRGDTGQVELRLQLLEDVTALRSRVEVPAEDQRTFLGASRGEQPQLAFIDKTGTLWKDAGAGWLGEATGGKTEHEVAADRLRERLERVGK